MTEVWVLSQGEQYEGGGVDGVYASEVRGVRAYRDACGALRERWKDVYQNVKTSKPLLEYLDEEIWEDPGRYRYHCACDFVTLVRHEVEE